MARGNREQGNGEVKSEWQGEGSRRGKQDLGTAFAWRKLVLKLPRERALEEENQDVCKGNEIVAPRRLHAPMDILWDGDQSRV
jgi:hypothetical protein